MEGSNNIFNNYLASFENLLNSIIDTNQVPPNNAGITTEFVLLLEKESRLIKDVCQRLNTNQAFINKTSSLFPTIAVKQVAELLVLSDLITISNMTIANTANKGKFVIAYFFDALIHNHYADSNKIAALNAICVSTKFQRYVEEIKAKYYLPVSGLSLHIPAFSSSANHDIEQLQAIYIMYAKLLMSITPINKQTELKISELVYPAKVNNTHDQVKEETLEDVLKELNDLVGLEEIKKGINELINLLKIQKIRDEKGLKTVQNSLHTVFLGPPGTGKTTVARLLGKIYKHLGYLKTGHTIETDREGLVAGYVGQTSIKVNELIQKSLGGVLFIDEAYSLSQVGSGNDYGNEAIEILLKRMEDNRDNLVVIVAGYTTPMKEFIESNSGLRSRFNTFYFFDHYKPEQLLLIFEGLCKKSDFVLTEDAKEKLADTFQLLYEKRDDAFGNARVVRNLFEICVQRQANRIVQLPELTPELLKTLHEEDVPEPNDTVKKVFYTE